MQHAAGTSAHAPASAAELLRIGTLRWLTLLAFNLAYVAVPILLYQRTSSIALVSAAMIVDGALRMLCTLVAGSRLRGLTAVAGLWIGCSLRLLALAVLLAMVLRPAWYSVGVVAAASTLYYLGHFVATLEQELRCARLGAHSGAGQTAYRIAEVVAPPVAFGLVLAAGAWNDDLPAIVAGAMAAVVLHAAMCLRWWRGDPLPVAVDRAAGLRSAWSHLRADGVLSCGLAATTLALGVFGWALLATPFALRDRVLFDLALDEAAGAALFKTVAALLGVAGAVVWGRLLRGPQGPPFAVAGALATPLLFAAALSTASDAAAVLLMATVCAILLGLFSWQRRLRQLRTPPALFPAVTAVCLSVECLGLSLAGAALPTSHPWWLATVLSAALALLLVPSLRLRARPAAAAATSAGQG